MTATELLERLPWGLDRLERTECGLSAHRLRRIRYACTRWESWRRRQGGMWPSMNRGLAGAARGVRLLTVLNGG